jgi:hypothetical protein
MDFFGFTDPSYSIGGGSGSTWGGGIDWQSIINQGFGLGSQAISAWGHNPTQQVGTGGIIGIGQGYSPAALLQASAQQQIAQQPVFSAPHAGPGGQGVAEDALGSLGVFVSQHPLMVFGGIAALFLLMTKPPSRR